MTKIKEHLLRRIAITGPRTLATAICFTLLLLVLYALLAMLNVVIISDSHGARRMLVTPIENSTELMEMSGIVAQENDNVFYTAYNGNLASLNIERAFPVVVNADGQSSTVELCSGTVEEVLAQAGVVLNEHDYAEPTLTTPVTRDMAPITVHRVIYEDSVAYEELFFETEYQLTSLFTRNKNKTIVLQEGSLGQREITTRSRVVDGQTESSKIVSNEVILEPQNRIIKKYGAGAPVSQLKAPDGITVSNGVPSSYSKVLTGRATAYSAERGRGSSGLGLYEGTVAVNPSVIPYGSKLYITSTDGKFVYGYAIATDTGSAMQEGHAVVDLFYDTYEEALLSAVRQVNVYVLN